MIIVYFETNAAKHAEIIATFADEEHYMLCLPALEKWAKENRGIITESVE